MPGIIIRVVRILRLIVLLVLICVVLFVWIASERRINHRYAVNASPVAVRSDSAGLARGRYLYSAITCALCHGEDGGGGLYFEPSPMATVAGANLTRGRGGAAGQRSDIDWIRAIRHGLRPDSTSLMLMPSEVFVHLSDGDLGAILGYLRSLPPVDRELPQSGYGLLGRALLATGRMNLLPASKTPAFEPPPDLAPGPTREYGRYLADISGCHGCHGFGLSGGAVAGPPGLPPASNLTPAGLLNWTEADLRRALREGIGSGGAPIDEFMPWKQYRHFTDEDIAALWQYLRSVPPRPFGGK